MSRRESTRGIAGIGLDRVRGSAAIFIRAFYPCTTSICIELAASTPSSLRLAALSTFDPSSFSPTFASLSLSQSEALLSLAGYTVVAPALSHPKSRNSLILSTVQGPFPTSAPPSLSLALPLFACLLSSSAGREGILFIYSLVCLLACLPPSPPLVGILSLTTMHHDGIALVQQLSSMT